MWPPSCSVWCLRRELAWRTANGKKELEKVMLEDFMQGEYDVLVATTLIENGLDIPRANT